MIQKQIKLLIVFLMLFIEGYGQSFVHPGVPFTTSDLNELKANITQQPWSTGYQALQGDYRSQLSYVASPKVTVGRAPDLNRNFFINDMTAIHNLAFMWIFTENPAYAQKATEILDAWATTNTQWTGDEIFLDLGDYAQYYTTGADILRSTYSGWTAANSQHVDNWFRNVLWPQADVPNPVRGHNQGAIQLKFAVGIAAYLGDPVLWQQAIDVYRKDAGGGLANSLSNGEVGDSGRDMGHWLGQVEALVWSAEVAWKQGIDLYSEYGNRLWAIAELLSSYRTTPANYTGQFIPFGGTYAYYGGWASGSTTTASMYYNIIHNAYAVRKGIATPSSDVYRNSLAENSLTFLYRKTTDTSSAIAPSSISYPSTKPAALLTNADVGTTGLSGSGTFSNGMWELNAAGTGIPVPASQGSDSFHFNFKEVSGDGTIVAKVTSNSHQAGIMFRESLAENSRFVGIMLTQDQGVVLIHRNATAWSKTNISWNNPPGGYQSHGGGPAPWWLKLERRDGRIYAYHSANGTAWTCIGIVVSAMSSEAYAGIYSSSSNTFERKSATFSDVAITSGAPVGAPEISSATTVTGTKGTAFLYTITASGSPSLFGTQGLPEGLTLDTVTGAISGNPTVAGSFLVKITAGNGSGADSALVWFNVADNVLPTAPQDLQLANTGIKKVKLSWEAVSGAQQYTVKRSAVSQGPYETILSGVTATTVEDTNAFPGNNFYIVTAIAGSLESASSEEGHILLPPDIPEKPIIVSENNQLTLTWAAAVGASAYNIKRSSVSGGPYTIIASAWNATSFVDQGVSNGNYYFYVISSVLDNLESLNSDEEMGVPGATSLAWDTQPQSSLWSEIANWDQNALPVSPAILSFGATTISTLNNDLVNMEIPKILFTEDAAAYTISGNAIVYGSEITNLSVNEQVLDLAGNLSQSLYLKSNTGGIRLTGVLNGNGKLVKEGSAPITVSGNNTYSGGTLITSSIGGWGPSAPFNITGEGQGTDGNPVSGPLGTGLVTLEGGALRNSGYARIFNTILVAPGTNNFLYSDGGSLSLAGGLTGSGTISHDGNSYDAINISGDNSQFSGRFISINRSSWSRLRFNNASSGSALAHWELNSTFSDAHRFSFNGVMELGALSGTGLLNTYNAPVLRIGARNESTVFSGVMTATNISIEKVGTGYLKFTGNNLNNGTTKVFEGALYVNGQYASATTAYSGTLGGIGTLSSPLIVGTGSGTGAFLAPGDEGVGVLTVNNTLTMNQDATFQAQFSPLAQQADAVTVTSIVLNNPALQFFQIDSGGIPEGTNFTIVNNVGNQPVSGTFSGLSEMSEVTLGEYQYFISYVGGTGNDIVLLDKRTTPALITSPALATGTRNTAFSYQITAVNNPISYNATGLPSGLSVDTTTGLISGIPSVSGVFTVVIEASNTIGSSTLPLTLTIMTNEAPAAPIGLIMTVVSSTSLKLQWEAADPGMFITHYNIKRAQSSGGPYTVVAGNVTGTSFTDTGLQQNAQYYYVISSVNAVGESQNSTEVTGTTPMPPIASIVSGVMAVGSNAKATLTWTAAYEAASYNVYRSPAQSGPFTLIGSTPSLSYEDTGLTNGNTYYYRITGVNITGENNPSGIVNATPDANAYARWSFDETTGTTATDVWNAHNGAVQQSNFEWTTGVMRNSLHLLGTSYVTLPSGIVSTLSNYTISTWVKLEQNSTWQRVFDFGNGSATNMFLTTNAGSNVVRFAIKNNNSAEQQLSATFPLTIGSWYHFAVTRSGNVARLYINGTQVAINNNMTIAPSAMGNTPLNYIGKSQYNDPILKALIDDFRIYNRALSATEIAQINAAIAPSAPLNLMASETPNGAALQWDAVENATSYTLYRGTAEGVYSVLSTNITATSFTDNSLPAGDLYYVVTANSNGVASAYSNMVVIQTPAAIPSNFKATSWNNRADLSWGLSIGAESYTIMRSYALEGTYSTLANITGTSYQDTTAVNSNVYFYKVAANNGSHSSVTEAASITPQLTPLSATWNHIDVGAVGVTGNANPGENTQTVYGSGADIWGNADAFHYMYTPLAGNAALIVKVTALQNTNASAKAGIMVREGLAGNAKHVTIDVKPNGGVELISRSTTGGGSVSAGATGILPQWIKLVKLGNTITGYTSANGTDWTGIGSQNIAMSGTVYAGLIACSHNNSVLASGEFSDFQFITQPEITSESVSATVSDEFSYQVSATNNPVLYSAMGLPDGLSINAATGFISGVPLQAGTYNVSVTATNELGNTTGIITLDVQSFNMRVLYQDADGAAANNSIKPFLKIQNNSSATVNYNTLKIRYWLTPENFSGISSWIDYAQLGGSHINMSYVILETPREGALGYVEYTFDSTTGALVTGNDSGIIQSRFANSNWGSLSEIDDYSHLTTGTFIANDKITLYRNGYLIWGIEPEAVEGQRAVRVLAQNSTTSASTNSIQNILRLENIGNLSIDYKDLTVRYWFTKEGIANMNYWIDYAMLGNSKINGTFVSGSFGTDANNYLEFSFTPSAGTLYPLSNTGDVQYRITKSDWSAFNQANDFSFTGTAGISQNQKITVYYKGALIYGDEPSAPSAARTSAPKPQGAQSLTDISIYPNPVESELHIVIADQDNYKVQVFDLTGKLLHEASLQKGGNTLTMDGFASGVYTLIVTDGTNTHVEKIVKK